MFTGIITAIGTIAAHDQRGDLRLTIRSDYDSATIALGASIACSGVCLTVVDTGRDDAGHWFAIDASGETVARTAPGMWASGNRLNLERALKVGDELGGHIVTGHVDGVGAIVAIDPVGDSWTVTIAAPAQLAASIAAKGSITIDGVSLTVNTVTDQPDGQAHFTVNIIPHTRQVTAIGAWTPGAAVNLEIDILARYLARMQSRTG